MIIHLFQSWHKNRQTRIALLAFFHDIEKNIEAFYVMQQLNKHRYFSLDGWKQMKDRDPAMFDEKILRYISMIEDYNKCIDDFTIYEKWYALDIKNRNQQTAQILHGKKEAVALRFPSLQIIKSAKDQLEIQLRQMNILKKDYQSRY